MVVPIIVTFEKPVILRQKGKSGTSITYIVFRTLAQIENIKVYSDIRK